MSTENRSALRLMIAERGIDGLLEDLSSVCKDIASESNSPTYANTWYDRAHELKQTAQVYAGPADDIEAEEQMEAAYFEGESNA